MNEMRSDWEHAFQQILKEPEGTKLHHAFHYENEKRLEKIRYQEELSQAKAIASACEERVKEMKLLMNKMEQDCREEKIVAAKGPSHHMRNEKYQREEEGQVETYETEEFDDNASFKTAEESLQFSATQDEEDEDDGDIVQVMKRHNSWMFNVVEDERDVATSPDGLGGGASIPLKKKPSLKPIMTNPTEDDDEEETEYNPNYYSDKKTELQHVLKETTTKVQELLFQLQALLSAVSQDALSAARIEKEEALQQARVQHVKNMEVILDSTVKSAAEEKKLIIKDIKARHKVELAAVRLNAGKATENEIVQKKKVKTGRNSITGTGSNRGSAVTRNNSITSFLSSSAETTPKSSQENTIPSTEHSFYRAQMEAALRSASVAAMREKEDALYKARVEHAAVLETVLSRAAAAEKRSRENLSTRFVTTQPQQAFASPPSAVKSISDANGVTWVKKEDLAVKVRQALRQAKSISSKSNAKIEEQRRGILKTPRHSNSKRRINKNSVSSSSNLDGRNSAVKRSKKATVVIKDKRKTDVLESGIRMGIQTVPAVA